MLTEGVGFEPTDRANPVNSFQGCRIQPLCHPSGLHQDSCPQARIEAVLTAAATLV